MGYSLGVDLGTTSVAAAIASATRLEMFALGDRSVLIPAIVYLRDDGTLIAGEAAALHAATSPDRVSREFKRRLGNPTPVVLGGRPHTVTALLGTLLREVLQKVTTTAGEPPDRVVLTHPVNWGPFRRALFEEVPQHAGLTNLPMVTEPEAAATHYAAARQLTDGATVAVYDLGGGTFDATILRKQPSGVEILGTPEGFDQLGGADFDEAILSLVDYAADGALRELDLRDPHAHAALVRLRQSCIVAKEALSVDTETIVPVLLPGRRFDVRITRSDFEEMVRPPIQSTIGALSRTLQSAQVRATDLSAILLTGGSAQIPVVARMVSAELGAPTVVDTHPQYTVALGAATLATQAPMPPAGTVFVTRHQPRDGPQQARDGPQQDSQPPPAKDPPGTAVHAPTNRTPLAAASPPGAPAAETVQWSKHRRAATTDPRLPRYRLLLTTATALVIAIAATVFVFMGPSKVGAGTGAARLVLSTLQVTIGETYLASASGFAPGEGVQFSWTGPTNGVMNVFPADSGGNKAHRVLERDPPGNYTIIASGLTSGRTATAALRVVPAGN